MRFLQTSRRFFNQGVELLYPSIGSDLACASRYVRAKVYKELCPAPFASTVLGVKVHERVAESLRSGLPVDREAFQLPRRLMINSGENLENLIGRAERSLNRYDSHYRPYLLGKALRVEERLSWSFAWGVSLCVSWAK
ncbi:MAG: hypothetical protein RML45_05095 [Acetobacteraceae bacterium]|nr:hypothetical protein [Acetobacteraceae bacterium]